MKNRKGFTLIELMIVIAIIGILAAIAIPNFKKARESARQKSCYANIRVILGAVEMYNMDSSQMMDTLDEAALVSAGYLKSQPAHPESDCSYSGSGLTNNGVIKCQRHKAIESDD